MIYKNIQAIILAAGKSSRFKTGKNKLLATMCGQEMILYATQLFARMQIPTHVVVGFQREQVQAVIERAHANTVECIVQEEQQGTGHAIVCTKSVWQHDNILIMNGDMPLVSQEIIEHLFAQHASTHATISFVTAHNADYTSGGYGRVVRENDTIEIVEAKNFTGDASKHCCVNAGIYLIKREFLATYSDAIQKNEIGKEFYLTDLIKIASEQKLVVTTVESSFDQVRGINTLQELWAAEQIKRGELIKYWMERGVRFSLAQNVHIDLDVTIGAGSTIGSGVHLFGKTTIGTHCAVQEFSSLENCVVGDHTTIASHSVIKNSTIGSHAVVGPFAHVHTNSIIGDHTMVGNFVEVKNSSVGNHTKAKHLTYLGDAELASHVNIGAGTIVCNHNGVTKNKTIIEQGAYIGSNNTLVAPLTIGQKAFTAAGSVITKNVPAESLAIARSQQTNKEGYAVKLRAPSRTKDSADIFKGALKTDGAQKTE